MGVSRGRALSMTRDLSPISSRPCGTMLLERVRIAGLVSKWKLAPCADNRRPDYGHADMIEEIVAQITPHSPSDNTAVTISATPEANREVMPPSDPLGLRTLR